MAVPQRVKILNLKVELDLHFNQDGRNAAVYLQFNVINF